MNDKKSDTWLSNRMIYKFSAKNFDTEFRALNITPYFGRSTPLKIKNHPTHIYKE